LIVIASIHQPSTSTFKLFDKLLLLSGGKSHYFGSVKDVEPQFKYLGYPVPLHTNPAEFLLEMMNIDFVRHQEAANNRLQEIQQAWVKSPKAIELSAHVEAIMTQRKPLSDTKPSKTNFPIVLMTLVHRSFIKSYRDIVAYGIRVAMYTGLAIMMGTVWLRLKTDQAAVESFTNAIVSPTSRSIFQGTNPVQFFGGAFMSFMAVAYIPSFLEDHATYIKDRANGLYGPTAFMLANFIIGLPYLCIFLTDPQTARTNIVSINRHSFLYHRLLAFQLPTNSTSILHLDHVALP
jgi:hypothetical protein